MSAGNEQHLPKTGSLLSWRLCLSVELSDSEGFWTTISSKMGILNVLMAMLTLIITSQVSCEFNPNHHMPLSPVDSRVHAKVFSTHHEIRTASAEQTEEQRPEKILGDFPNSRVCNPFFSNSVKAVSWKQMFYLADSCHFIVLFHLNWEILILLRDLQTEENAEVGRDRN